MKNPITTVKQKIDEHKVAIAATAGTIAGTAGTIYFGKKLGWHPPIKHPIIRTMDVENTVEEVKGFLDKNNFIEFRNTLGDRITFMPSDVTLP